MNVKSVCSIAAVLLVFLVARQAQGQLAPVLLEPDYGSPTYLAVRDEATRTVASYGDSSVQVIRWRIALVNWEALAAAGHTAESGDKQLNPPLELIPFDDLSCRLSVTRASFSKFEPGQVSLSFSRCDRAPNPGEIRLTFDPNRRVLFGQAEIQGSSFHFARLSEGHVAAIQVKYAPVTLDLN